MKLKKLYFIIILLVLLAAFSFILSQKKNFDSKSGKQYVTLCGIYETVPVQIAEDKLNLYVADNICKKTTGLSGKAELKADEGMLFLFDKAGNYGFWMKDMNFPIDIVWLGEDFTVLGVEKDLKPSTFPSIFGQNYTSKYVLELPSGISEKDNIKVGNKIIF